MRDQHFDSLIPLLILGEGRSGTTLLMQLLGTSRRIAFDRIYPYEVRYLTYLLQWALLLGRKSEPDEYWNPAKSASTPDGLIGPLPHPDAQIWDGQAMWPSCFRHAWRLFTSVAARGATADATVLYYAEKVSHWIPECLQQAIPYKIIVLVRDPRDVFLSVTAFDKKRGFSGFDRLPEDDDWTYARRFIDLQKGRFPLMHNEATSPRGILVKYERLAMDLAGEAKRLSEWLGLELNAKAVEDQASEFAHHMTSDNPHASVGRWRREMSQDMNEFFLGELGEEMRYFGYTY
ncbi:MAG: sulfotransferase domain-containing protein [Acidobacteriota bacterium]